MGEAFIHMFIFPFLPLGCFKTHVLSLYKYKALFWGHAEHRVEPCLREMLSRREKTGPQMN